MAEKNVSEDELDRAEAADRLRTIADDLEEGEEFNVDIGNKTISLSPTSVIGFEVGARESSSILRGSRESVTITMGWRPD
ncbi:amphi-Trp domain-containing protein [Halobacteriales archaeon SW_12_67_38]|nr:MAG: amphi-Trp domain-containing protein [Halobacteriales archaeon QH_9_66_26]PSQ50608.1 MAG: amphi-Trp domain-containing protein [Halobacteriales archaeon SW_12_67_38]